MCIRDRVEPGFDAAALAALAECWPLNCWPVQDVYFGGVHVAAPDSEGAGDSRRGGAAALIEVKGRVNDVDS